MSRVLTSAVRVAGKMGDGQETMTADARPSWAIFAHQSPPWAGPEDIVRYLRHSANLTRDVSGG